MERYPDWTKQQLMLLWSWDKLQEAYDAGDRSSLRVQIDPGFPGISGMGVHVWLPVDPEEEGDPNVHSRRVNVSEEIPELSRGAEAVAVFEQLRREGLIAATIGRANSGAFHDLSNEGRVQIGKFPEPGQKLAAALEAVLVSIEQDPTATDAQRQSRLSVVSQTATLLNTVPELGRKVARALEQMAGGG